MSLKIKKYLRKAVKTFRKPLNNYSRYSELRSAGGCPEFIKRRDADVFVISYPKSGRTWLRLMLGKYLTEIYDCDHEGLLEIYNLTQKMTCLPRIAFVHDGSSLAPKSRKARKLGKSKDLYKQKKVILLVRDPRDVVVSYYLHCTRREKIYEGKSISEFIRDDRFGVIKIITFLNIWAKNRFIPNEFLLVRYEDFHENACRELVRVLEFVGSDICPEIVGSAVDFASFENMRQLEMNGVDKSGRLSPGDTQDPESYKTRKGVIGGYLSYLSQKDIDYTDNLIQKKLSPYYSYAHYGFSSDPKAPPICTKRKMVHRISKFEL